MRHALRRMRKRWFRERRRPNGGCQACGVCCEYFAGTLRASSTDLQRWERQGRRDLLAGVGVNGRIWLDPQSRDLLEPCPFLNRVDAETGHCRIHATKPAMCRDYPTPAHGERCVRGLRFR